MRIPRVPHDVLVQQNVLTLKTARSEVNRRLLGKVAACGAAVMLAASFAQGAPPAAVVWVDDDFTAGSCGGHTWGYDAFTNIQAGVNAVAASGTVNVAAGLYAENVVVSRPTSLLGPNAGVAGCVGRGTEATIAAGPGVAVDITSDDVTVDGLALSGLTGVRNVGHEGVEILNNAVTALAVGIDVESVATTLSRNVAVRGNCVTLASQLAGATPTVGMLLAGVTGAAAPLVVSNEVSNAFYGYILYALNAASPTVIDSGSITGVMQGVAVLNVDPQTGTMYAPSSFGVADVSMSGFTGNYATTPVASNYNMHVGVYVFTGGTNPLAAVSGSVTRVAVDGTGKVRQDCAGLSFSDFSSGAAVRQTIAVEECTLIGNLNRGIIARGSNAVVTIQHSTLTGSGADPYGVGGNDGFGLSVFNGAHVDVSETFITNPSAVAGGYSAFAVNTFKLAGGADPVLTLHNCSLDNNGCPTGKLAVRSDGTLNASGNWWGSSDEATVAALITGSVDFTPNLNSGTDTNGVAAGFQGSFATLHVTALGAQTSGGRVEEAIDAVDAGGLVYVKGGVYGAGADATAKALTLAAGASPAQVVLNGDFTLSGDDTLPVELQGATPGAGYDQWVVNGAVNLGGATLSATATFSYPPGFTNVLIANDGADAVTGTFAGLPNGAELGISGQAFLIHYDGGDGNDVTLTVEPPPALAITTPPASVPYGVSAYTLSGTSANVQGSLVWSNALTAATGTAPAGAAWTAVGIPLGVGTNAITVRGANLAGAASASVTIIRNAFGVFTTPYIATTAGDVTNTLGGTTIINHGLVAVGHISASALDSFGESFGSVSSMQITDWSTNADGSYSGTLNILPDRGYNSGNFYADFAARINKCGFRFTPYYGSTNIGGATALEKLQAQTNQLTFGTVSGVKFTYNDPINGPGTFTTGLDPATNSRTLFGLSMPYVTTYVGLQSPNAASNTTYPGINKLALDCEALVLKADGSGYIGDEYGATVYYFNTAKQIVGAIVPPAAFQPHSPSNVLFYGSGSTPVNGRRNNQGFEGVSLSPDGTRLFALLQSACVQDSDLAANNQKAKNTRLLVYDVSASATPTAPVAEYALTLPVYKGNGNGGAADKTCAQSEIVALDTNRLLVLSRDGNGLGNNSANPNVYKTVLLVDTSVGAPTDIAADAARNAEAGRITTASGVLDPAITALSYTEAVNLLNSTQLAKFNVALDTGAAQVSKLTLGEKWEGMALVSARDPANPNDYFLFVGNDNDFVTSDGRMRSPDGTIVSYNAFNGYPTNRVPAPLDSANNESDTRILAYRVTIAPAVQAGPPVTTIKVAANVYQPFGVGLTNGAWAYLEADPSNGSPLRATQRSLGYREVVYKAKLFSSLQLSPVAPTTTVNGLQYDYTAQNAKSTYTVGYWKDKDLPIMVGPDGNAYITDGHHTSAGYLSPDNAQSGDVVPGLHRVVLGHVFTNFYNIALGPQPADDAWWLARLAENNSFLYGVAGNQLALPADAGYAGLQPILPSVTPMPLTPSTLGPAAMTHDHYRGLTWGLADGITKCATNGASKIKYSKTNPDNGLDINFVEFFWADYLRNRVVWDDSKSGHALGSGSNDANAISAPISFFAAVANGIALGRSPAYRDQYGRGLLDYTNSTLFSANPVRWATKSVANGSYPAVAGDVYNLYLLDDSAIVGDIAPAAVAANILHIDTAAGMTVSNHLLNIRDVLVNAGGTILTAWKDAVVTNSTLTIPAGTGRVALRGSNTVSGAVKLAGGTFAVQGSLAAASFSMAPGATLEYTPTGGVPIAVSGNVALNGTLNVTGSGFGTGVYTIATCGSLSGAGLTIGAVSDASLRYSVLTNVAGQVQLEVKPWILTVISAHGTPVPSGVTTQASGGSVSATVAATVSAGATQYVNTGWSMTGNAPAAGASNQVSFTITNDATLAWQWKTQYWLNTEALVGGTVGQTDAWVDAGFSGLISATPQATYAFSHWTGDVVSAVNPLPLTMSRAYAVTAVFTPVPALQITSPAHLSAVAYDQASVVMTLNAAHIVGGYAYSNAILGVGNSSLSTTNRMAVRPGTNVLTVSGIDVFGAPRSDSVTVIRAPVDDRQLTLGLLGTLGITNAEIVAFDAATRRAFVSGASAGIRIVDLSAPFAPTIVGSVLVGSNVNSVAVRGSDGLVAAAVEAAVPTQPGQVIFLNSAGAIQGAVTVGIQPDMVTFSPDGTKVLTANEAETADHADYGAGSVSVIDLSGGAGAATVTTLDFGAYDSQTNALRAAGVRIFPGRLPSVDFEPEYVAVAPDGLSALVTLQENNALAKVSLSGPGSPSITQIIPLGLKDHSLPGNRLDASDQDGMINITNWPVFGMYMPDAIASYSVGGQTYYVTANEGDVRDTGTDEKRIGSLSLDPTVFPNAAFLKLTNNLGRLTASEIDGDLDGDGDRDRLQIYGGRSISIYNSAGSRIYDSGDALEVLTAVLTPTLFNANDGVASKFDQRSDDKGCEPEGVEMGVIGGCTYAFVTLERAGGGIVASDVTLPTKPLFMQYARRDGDVAPEGAKFVSATNSPSGKSLVLVANETSQTLTIYEIETGAHMRVLTTNTVVAPTVTMTTVNGTFGEPISDITWSNAFTGATGTATKGAGTWSAAIPLAGAANPITFRATGPAGVLTDSVTLTRSGPRPDIKVNGSDSAISVANGSTVSVMVSLDPDVYSGANVDWWLVRNSPLPVGWWSYVASSRLWMPIWTVTATAPLGAIAPTEVYRGTLPPGVHTFYFGVEIPANGRLDMDMAFYDYVTVTVRP